MQGGSTLTQQLAKNLFLTQERTASRKIQEAILALWLEHNYSKDQILELYLNRVYFGSGRLRRRGGGAEVFRQVRPRGDARPRPRCWPASCRRPRGSRPTAIPTRRRRARRAGASPPWRGGPHHRARWRRLALARIPPEPVRTGGCGLGQLRRRLRDGRARRLHRHDRRGHRRRHHHRSGHAGRRPSGRWSTSCRSRATSSACPRAPRVACSRTARSAPWSAGATTARASSTAPPPRGASPARPSSRSSTSPRSSTGLTPDIDPRGRARQRQGLDAGKLAAASIAAGEPAPGAGAVAQHGGGAARPGGRPEAPSSRRRSASASLEARAQRLHRARAPPR